MWDYPRPPRAERIRRRVRIVHGGTLLVETEDVVRVLETSHPPTYYLSRSEFRVPLLAASRITMCEWKGEASYFDIEVPGVKPLRFLRSQRSPRHRSCSRCNRLTVAAAWRLPPDGRASHL